MFSFGKKSRERLETCAPELRLIMQTAITRSSVDFGISQGARTYEKQLDYFTQGKSKLDPRRPESLARAMHVITEDRPLALAVDIYAYHPVYEVRKKIAYDIGSLCYIAGVIQAVAKELYVTGTTTHLIRWGGNWDKDAVILHDQSFDDLPHFELYKPEA